MRRTMTLILALLTGTAAAAGVFVYVNAVESRSTDGLTTKAVLVVNRFLPAGTTAEQIVEGSAFDVQEIPERYVSPGALSSLRELNPQATLTDALAAGEQITTQRFRQNRGDAFLAQFPAGTEALSMPLERVRGVAGRVSAGSRINAYVTANELLAVLTKDRTTDGLLLAATNPQDLMKKIREMSGAMEIPRGLKVFSTRGNSVTFQLADIPVIEVGGAVAPGAEAAVGEGPSGRDTTMTLAVTPEQAALLINAQEKAKLWFTLVPQEEERS